MKASVAKLLKKLSEDLLTVCEYVIANKKSKALDKLDSIIGKLHKKTAKVKTPKARKPSAYALFLKAHYKDVKAANPGKSLGEISKIISKLYHAEKDGVPVPKSPVKAVKSPKSKSPKAEKAPKSPKASKKSTKKPKA